MPETSRSLLWLSAVLTFVPLAATPQEPVAFPTPAEIASSLRLDPGLRAELVAAEPQIESPVAMAFDEEGRLWVVEMRDYPHGPPPGMPPESRIKVLDDRDGDGRFETSTVFQETISFPNGVLPWRGGVLVTAAPYIKWLKDNDGDGRADQEETLYEGFSTVNPQLRVSHPNLGLDGWVYVANGLRGGRVRRHGRGSGSSIELGGMDFRFDPRNADRYETISGMGQFGLTFDDWGRRFVCDNRHHLRHIVLPHHALARNPYLAAPAVVQDVPYDELGEGDSGARTFPLSKNWTTSSLALGRFTAACSVFVYRGGLLPAAYRGAVFTCDPTGNLVHQEFLEEAGATFRSRPARAGVEFLASTDDRFRPVFLAHGPDGALYVVDMARAVIEHPQFMPTELKNRPDLLVGKDKGRIWRIVPDSNSDRDRPRPRPRRPHLTAAPVEELVALLGHPNVWRRTTAQRLLLARSDPKAPPLLRTAVESATEPLARLQAAWLLDAFGALDAEPIADLARADSAGLRENAAALAASRLAHSPALQERLVALAVDPAAKVRFQAAMALGQWDDDRIIAPLAQIALAGASDPWTRLAVASAVPTRAGLLLAALVRARPGGDHEAPMVRALAAVVGARNDASEVASVLEVLLTPGTPSPEPAQWQLAGVSGLVEGMARRGTRFRSIIAALPSSGVSRNHADALKNRLDAVLGQAAVLASDTARPAEARSDAVRLLGQAPWDAAEPVLARLLTSDPDPNVRLAAARAAAAQDAPEVGHWILRQLRSVTPAVRRELLASVVSNPERVALLLDEVEAHRLAPSDLDATALPQLLRGIRSDLRERARTLLQDSAPEERRAVLKRYAPAVDREGDAARGRLVFQKNCATCHNVAGVGTRVGPDIADTRMKTRSQLLSDILNPNGAIDGNYLAYTVATRSGQILSGLIAAESATSLTLKRAEGQTDVILRQDIDEVRSTGASLMPEGLERSIAIDEMSDLLTFLKNWRYEGGKPPG
jgi:putative membrane-bound dehydrogenase-like protein